MSIADQLLDKIGVSFEKLTPEERSTYFDMLKVEETKAISIDEWKEFISQMIIGIQSALVESKDGTDESKQFKSRLKNMIVLQNFLDSPIKAKQALDKYYKNYKL